MMVNLLEKLNYSRTILIQAKDAEGREDGEWIYKLISPRDAAKHAFEIALIHFRTYDSLPFFKFSVFVCTKHLEF